MDRLAEIKRLVETFEPDSVGKKAMLCDMVWVISEIERSREDNVELLEALKNERIISSHKNDEIERLRKIEDAAVNWMQDLPDEPGDHYGEALVNAIFENPRPKGDG